MSTDKRIRRGSFLRASSIIWTVLLWSSLLDEDLSNSCHLDLPLSLEMGAGDGPIH